MVRVHNVSCVCDVHFSFRPHCSVTYILLSENNVYNVRLKRHATSIEFEIAIGEREKCLANGVCTRARARSRVFLTIVIVCLLCVVHCMPDNGSKHEMVSIVLLLLLLLFNG